MTREECLEKIEELKKEAIKIIDDKTLKILNSGFIDVENAQNNYLIPKVILCVSLKFAEAEFTPLSDAGKKELKNLELI